MMRERKSSHKKCKSLKRGLQIFLPVFGAFWAVRQVALRPEHYCLKAVQTAFKQTGKNTKITRCNELKRRIKVLERWSTKRKKLLSHVRYKLPF